jgi:sulfatase modifying factor 1
MKCVLLSLSLLLFLQPANAQRKYNSPVVTGPMDIPVVKVQGGNFDLGDDYEAMDRKPAHTVTLKDFNMGEYEVTQAQWKSVMGNNPSVHACDDCPVNNVSFKDVQEFIGKLNSGAGKHYRLPTEAEWEYAARGGVNEKLSKSNKNALKKNEGIPDKELAGKKYSGKKLPQDVAWFQRNSDGRVHAVGMKKPNELGIYDMSGNVEEWCADWYAGNYGSALAVENPRGPASGNAHVVRGGAYNSDRDDLVLTFRKAYTPDVKAPSLGFRLVEDSN